MIIPTSCQKEQSTPSNNEMTIPGSKAKNAKFTQKLRQKIFSFFIDIMILSIDTNVFFVISSLFSK